MRLCCDWLTTRCLQSEEKAVQEDATKKDNKASAAVTSDKELDVSMVRVFLATVCSHAPARQPGKREHSM